MKVKFLVNLMARLEPLTVAIIYSVLAPQDTYKILAYGAEVCMLGISEYLGIYRPLQNFEDTKRKQLDVFFQFFVETAQIGDFKASIRVNVMLAQWNWVGRHFFQYYQYQMDGYPDANLHFCTKKGLCGEVFHKRKSEVIYADLRQLTRADAKRIYHFTDDEINASEHVKAVVCVPLFRKRRTLRGTNHDKYYGVLNIDALDDAGVELLKKEEIQKQIKAFAAFVQI